MRGVDGHRVAGVDAGALDVLHDAGDEHVARRRRSRRPRPLCPRGTCRSGPACPARPRARARGSATSSVGVLDDLHRAPAEHVAGAHEHRVADGLRPSAAPPRACGRRRPAAAGCRAAGGSSSKRRRSSARSIVSALEPTIGSAGAVQRLGEVDRRLPAELDDRAAAPVAVARPRSRGCRARLFVERLEVEAVARCRSRSRPSRGSSSP